MIDHGSETWLENWQTSDQSEACGTPISFFDGANTEMTWEYNPLFAFSRRRTHATERSRSVSGV